MKTPSFIFFGTSEYAVGVAEILHTHGFIPLLVVTRPDQPKGRGLKLTPPPAKVWAEEKKISVIQPEKLDGDIVAALALKKADVFIVVAYGKIIPESVLNIPPHKTINVHFSLLPKYRGASPIQSQILADDRNAGTTIMLVDKELDHGPIIAQSEVEVNPWPPTSTELSNRLIQESGELLAKILPDYVSEKIKPVRQDESKATFTKKIEKEDGAITLGDDPYKNYLKFQALSGWPGTYFFAEVGGKRTRIIIKKASFQDGRFTIETIVPEGKKETDYKTWRKIQGLL